MQKVEIEVQKLVDRFLFFTRSTKSIFEKNSVLFVQSEIAFVCYDLLQTQLKSHTLSNSEPSDRFWKRLVEGFGESSENSNSRFFTSTVCRNLFRNTSL